MTDTSGSDDRGFAKWLISEGRSIGSTLELMERACGFVRGQGIPLDRAVAVGFLVHPLVHGVSYSWEWGKGASYSLHPHGLQHLPAFRNSPVAKVVSTRSKIRLRLDSGLDLEYPLYEELRDAGFTDYFALPVLFRDGGKVDAVTVATRDPAGFSDADLESMEEYAALFGLVFETEVQRMMTRTVLRTYLGRDAGDRVMQGQVQRGDGKIIESCILMCDLRGFSHMSDHAPVREVLQLLDEYFEVVVGAVEDNSGEVLKFIGDAVLAVFRVSDTTTPQSACRAAIAAVRAAQSRAAEVNVARKSLGRRPIDFGVGLHYGEVLYGNIGSLSRLDFTVIGRAVNTVSRIADLCAPLAEPVLMTGEVAEHISDKVCSAGSHSVKGMDAPLDLFKLSEGPLH